MSNILVGTRRLEIAQKRPFGPLIIFDGSVEIRENESLIVEFAVPGLTSTERVSFDAFWEVVDDAVAESDKEKAEEHFMTAFDLLERAEASEELIALRETWRRRYAGIDSEFERQSAAETKVEEVTNIIEKHPELLESTPDFALIEIERRTFAGEIYTFRGVKYRAASLSGYQKFYADLADTPGLPQWFQDLVLKEKSAETKGCRRKYLGVVIAAVGSIIEIAGVSRLVTDKDPTSLVLLGSSVAIGGLIVELIGNTQIAKHRPSIAVIPAFNRRIANSELGTKLK